MATLQIDWALEEAREISKAAPGLPPQPGWEWHEETKRWRNPENWKETVEFDIRTTPSWNDLIRNVPLGDWSKLQVSDLVRHGAILHDTLRKVGEMQRQDWEAREQPSYVNSDDHQMSVGYYRTNGYHSVNEKMRFKMMSEMTGSELSLVSEMSSLMSPIKNPQKLYRGIVDIDVLPEAGEVQAFDSFLSCSRDPSVAWGFAEPSDRTESKVLMELEATPETWGMTLDDVGFAVAEYETILDAGQVIEVESVSSIQIVNYRSGSKGYLVKGRVRPKTREEVLSKAAPGLRPSRYGPHVVWSDDKRRWVDGRKNQKNELIIGSIPVSESNSDILPLLMDIEESSKLEQKLRDLFITPSTQDLPIKELMTWIVPYLNRSEFLLSTQEAWNDAILEGEIGRDPLLTPDFHQDYYGGEVFFPKNDVRGVVQDRLNSMISYAIPLGIDVPLYRGISSGMENVKPGEMVTLDVPTSTSFGIEVPWLFSQGETILEIQGSAYAPVLTENESQAEAVLMPGTSLRIKGVYNLSNLVNRYIVAEYVPPWKLEKAAPGPPPQPHWQWHEETRRWRNPANWEESSEGQDFPEGGIGEYARHSPDYPGAGKVWDYDRLVEYGVNVIDTFKAEEQPSYVSARDHLALKAYVNNEYKSINEAFRFGTPLEDHHQTVVKEMQKLMVPLEKPQLLFRGMTTEWFDEEMVGQTLLMDSFTSCSRVPLTGINFTASIYADTDEGGMLLEIHTTPTTRGITIADKDTGLHENETILDTGQRLYIESLEQRYYKPPRRSGRVVMYARGIVVPDEPDEISKAPPGLKPERYGPNVGWDDQKRRWVDQSRSSFPMTEAGEVKHLDLWDYWQETEWGFDPKSSPSYVDVNLSKKSALSWYMSLGHSEINEGLRSKRLSPELKQIVQEISTQMRPMGEVQHLYRGIAIKDANFEQIIEGGSVDSFLSTSRDPSRAIMFAKTGGRDKVKILLEIFTTPNTGGVTTVSQEDETILDYGTVLRRVGDVQQFKFEHDVYFYARMEVVDPVDDEISKAAPGLPPQPHWVWNEGTRRWRNPANWRQEGVEPQSRTLDELRDEAASIKLDAQAQPSYASAIEHKMIYEYTQMQYVTVNSALREGGELWGNSKLVVDELMSLVKPLENPQHLFRGINKVENTPYKDAKVGSVFRLDGFTSTTRNPLTAHTFMEHRDESVMLEIETTPKTQGITLYNRDTLHEEDETILGPGQAFEVIDVGVLEYTQREPAGLWARSNVVTHKRSLIKGRIIQLKDVERVRIVKLEPSAGIEKAPPGPPPKSHWVWYEETRRWRNPANWDESVEHPNESGIVHSIVSPIVAELNLPGQFYSQLMAKNQLVMQYGGVLTPLLPTNPGEFLSEVFEGADYQQMVRNTLDRTSVYIAIKPANLAKVFKEGRFKNSMETGKGTFKSIGEKRLDNVEMPVFGLTRETPVEQLPKYGFLASSDRMDFDPIVGWGYGTVYVKFRDSVKSQSTATLGDSYDGNHRPTRITAATSLIDVNAEAFLSPLLNQTSSFYETMDQRREMSQKWLDNPDDYRALLGSSIHAGTYIEAQVHGELPVDMIESIEVESLKDKVRFEQLVKRSGLNIEVKAAQYDTRLKELLEWDYDKSHSVNDEDVDLLGELYLDSILLNNLGWVYNKSMMGYPIPEVDIALDELAQLAKPTKNSYLRALQDLVIKRDEWNQTSVEDIPNLYRRHERELIDLLKTSKSFHQDGRKLIDKYYQNLPEGVSSSIALTYRTLMNTWDGEAQRVRVRGWDVEVKRHVVKTIYGIKAMGSASGLEKLWYDNFRPSQVGWVKDVANQELLS